MGGSFGQKGVRREVKVLSAYKTQTFVGLFGWSRTGVGTLELLSSCLSAEAMVERPLSRALWRRKARTGMPPESRCGAGLYNDSAHVTYQVRYLSPNFSD